MGSERHIPDEKLEALTNWEESTLFDDRERLVLEYADAITWSDRDVDDDLFARLQQMFSDDEIIELTMIIAWENSSSKFNRALRIPSQGLWQQQQEKRRRRATN